MRSASQGFLDHLSRDTTCLCHLWKVERLDENIFGFTDHPRDLDYPELTYLSSAGFDSSAIENASDLSVDNLELSTFESDLITIDDIEGGLWDMARVTLMLAIYTNPELGTMTLRSGKLGEIRAGRISLVAELRGLMQGLQFEIGSLYTVDCDADLGDERCKVDLESYRMNGEVTSFIDARRFSDAMLMQPDAWFRGSRLDWRTGMNAGLAMEVKNFSGGNFELQQKMPKSIAVGDEFTDCRGCDKQKETCQSFGNYVNYRGFPDLPGLDRILSGK